MDRGIRAQELCESRGGRPGLPVPNSPYGLCGRKATVNLREVTRRHGYSLRVLLGHGQFKLSSAENPMPIMARIPSGVVQNIALHAPSAAGKFTVVNSACQEMTSCGWRTLQF